MVLREYLIIFLENVTINEFLMESSNYLFSVQCSNALFLSLVAWLKREV